MFNEYFVKVASNIRNEDPFKDDETIDDMLCTYKGCEVTQRTNSNIPPNVPHDIPTKLLKLYTSISKLCMSFPDCIKEIWIIPSF